MSGDSDASADGEAGDSLTDRAAAATDSDVSEWLSLEPGEEVVWVGEPTKLRMVGTLVTGVVLIPFLIGIVILLFSPLSYLGIKHTDYVVTNRSLYVKQGILSTNIESVDLDRIQNTEFTQSFWGTQLGFGTIEISTAGSSGADISFDDVEDARDVREEISRVQREFGGGGGRDGTGGGSDDRAPGRRAASADQLEELVAELRATREALERVEARMGERSDGRSDDAPGEATDGADAVTSDEGN
ncbi:PH domain-containing protein [Halosimplex pelagicum]|uniref:PH domain-containing protein n=1 Tax=Halosimplex pelagicum TaxID=869886 RepID=A0A7D5TAD5_9EURY|nr:PH domain-containing protein [Halosimplex pelagicum]QLH80455.1 PH domain-containing protein [Halosimplex pelagicum]